LVPSSDSLLLNQICFFICAFAAFQKLLKKLKAVGNTESIAAMEQMMIPKRWALFTAFSMIPAHINRSVDVGL